MKSSFKVFIQPDATDCGPTCLRMVARHHGRSISLAKIRSLSETTREGSSLKNLADAAEKIGFRTIGVKINFEKRIEDAPLPCIVHWRQNHFVVVYDISGRKVHKSKEKLELKVAEPPHGLTTGYHQKMDYKPGMTGTAEIITEDLRLIERIFYSIRKIFE